jgi:hypothetical protein
MEVESKCSGRRDCAVGSIVIRRRKDNRLVYYKAIAECCVAYMPMLYITIERSRSLYSTAFTLRFNLAGKFEKLPQFHLVLKPCTTELVLQLPVEGMFHNIEI